VIPVVKDQGGEASILPVLEAPMSPEAESFRTLVTNIEFSSTEGMHKALLVTSSGAGEGKSFVAANLAVAMAQTKERVILVDCDMRKASQHKIFRADNQVGLANLIVGNIDMQMALHDTDVPNLQLITCGPTPPNPVELLRSRRLADILEKLRGSCDMIICDSPPVLPVADALVMASRMDAILFVADLNRTPREVIRQAQEQLARLEVPLLGLICNRIGAVKYNSYYHYRASDKRSDAAMGI
jgi:capsular exopolysaccharide synthesis family protein